MVILVERSGAYHSVALVTTEAVGVIIFVPVTCTLAHNTFIACIATFGKPPRVTILAVWLMVVHDEGHSCQLLLTTGADEASGMVCAVFILHSFVSDGFITGCAPRGTVTIITLCAKGITLMPHKWLLHQRHIAHYTIETSAMPEIIFRACISICRQDATVACRTGHCLAAGCTGFTHHLITFSKHSLVHQLFATTGAPIAISMPELVILFHLRLTGGNWLVTHRTFVSKQLAKAVDTVEVIILFNVRFSMELFVTFPATEMFLMPCFALGLCKAVIED